MKLIDSLTCRTSATSLSGTAIALGIALAAAAAPTTALNAAPSAQQDSAILMSVGGSQAINLPAKMSDVVIGDPDVVDVHVRSQNQLYLIAKKPGQTTVYATASNGKVLFSGTIRVGNNLTSIDDMLRLAMPDSTIAVNKMNGMVLLTGTIKAPEDAAEAERLTQAFVGKETTVVSRLRMATPLQVMLQVKISEVSRDVGHKIGTNFSSRDPGGRNNVAGGIGGGTRDFVDFNDEGGGTFNFPINGGYSLAGVARVFGLDVAGALDLAESSGLATTLAPVSWRGANIPTRSIMGRLRATASSSSNMACNWPSRRPCWPMAASRCGFAPPSPAWTSRSVPAFQRLKAGRRRPRSSWVRARRS